MTLLFVTSNRHKFAEGQRALNSFGVKIKHLNLSYPEPRAESCEEVVAYSLELLRKRIHEPFFMEDSGLFIKALNGFPGALSAFAFRKIGNKGILALMKGKRDRRAAFVSAIGFWDGSKAHAFVGMAKGRISQAMRGSSGFGYDPIFIPDGSAKTFAQDYALKQKISHRARSFRKFGKFLAKWLNGSRRITRFGKFLAKGNG